MLAQGAGNLLDGGKIFMNDFFGLGSNLFLAHFNVGYIFDNAADALFLINIEDNDVKQPLVLADVLAADIMFQVQGGGKQVVEVDKVAQVGAADGLDIDQLAQGGQVVSHEVGRLEGAEDVRRLRRQRLLNQCDLETVVQHHYTKGCMLRRNRYMVDRSSLLIAVYDGTPKGGTMNTLAYALRQGVETIILDV